jgi:hypothetical protein
MLIGPTISCPLVLRSFRRWASNWRQGLAIKALAGFAKGATAGTFAATFAADFVALHTRRVGVVHI